MSSSKTRATRKNKENLKGYLDDYTLAAWTSHDYLVATTSAAAKLLATASPLTAPAWAPTSPTTSPIPTWARYSSSTSFFKLSLIFSTP
ncbi:hypothetical protein COP2_030381 [Malus domestica]